MEVLENVSAKGGDLLSRTVQNFQMTLARDELANGHEEGASGDEEVKTPKEEKMDIDEPGSGASRSTRGEIWTGRVRHKSTLIYSFGDKPYGRHHRKGCYSNRKCHQQDRPAIRPVVLNPLSLQVLRPTTSPIRLRQT